MISCHITRGEVIVESFSLAVNETIITHIKLATQNTSWNVVMKSTAIYLTTVYRHDSPTYCSQLNMNHSIWLLCLNNTTRDT
jgi:hypothetical protein